MRGNSSHILKLRKPKFLLFVVLLTALSVPVFAQTSGNGSNLVTQIDGWKDTVKTVLNAVVGLMAIVGGFLVFLQYMQGNDQAQRNLIRLVIGLGIMGSMAGIVSVFI